MSIADQIIVNTVDGKTHQHQNAKVLLDTTSVDSAKDECEGKREAHCGKRQRATSIGIPARPGGPLWVIGFHCLSSRPAREQLPSC